LNLFGKLDFSRNGFSGEIARAGDARTLICPMTGKSDAT